MSEAGGKEAKDTARDSRLRWSKRAEQHLRDELAYYARQQCKDVMGVFADCAKAHGMWVVLRCREENRKMNECLHEYTNEAKFEEWRKLRANEMPAKEELVRTQR